MRPRIYEAMFLLDSREVKKDAAAVEQKIAGILEKNGAKVVVARRWDERKLAFEVRGQKRATYYLAYFECPPDRITLIRREFVLTESILRALLLAVESIPPAAFEAPPQERAVEGEVVPVEAAGAATLVPGGAAPTPEASSAAGTASPASREA